MTTEHRQAFRALQREWERVPTERKGDYENVFAAMRRYLAVTEAEEAESGESITDDLIRLLYNGFPGYRNYTDEQVLEAITSDGEDAFDAVLKGFYLFFTDFDI